jgi:hypothetical protein
MIHVIAQPSSYTSCMMKASRDHPVISRYEGSVITQYDTITFEKYPYVSTGKGIIENPCNIKYFEGKVVRIMYLAPTSTTIALSL